MWQATEIPTLLSISQLYSLFTHRYAQGYVFPGEVHNFWECVYVRRGHIRAVSGENTYCLSGGELMFHQPLELHRFNVLSEDGAELLIFSFSMGGEAVDFFREKVFLLSPQQQVGLDAILRLASTIPPDADPADPKTVAIGLRQSPLWLQRVAIGITALLLQLYEQPCAVPYAAGADAETFRHITRYMQENIGCSLPLAELSKIFFISQTGIKRLFKRYTGIGVHAYFLKLKLSAAARALQEGRSVSETATLLGFCDPGYFSVSFKKETGLSPSEYRRCHNR